MEGIGRAQKTGATQDGLTRFEGRFRILGSLGEGAMGTVVRAYDERRRHEVALKYLQRANPDGIYQFKQEFRLLAGTVHPNIVTLYELLAEGEQWALVMELVPEARSFLDFVRPHQHLLRAPSSSSVPSRERTSGSVNSTDATCPGGAFASQRDMRERLLRTPRRAALVDAQLRVDRLRDALVQLVDALDCVHQQGLLHRDIKPMNVLVDPVGRLVVCDFGLVVARSRLADEVAGTPVYMSPEQALRRPLSAASDFYSVGVLLYEALTGCPPHLGSIDDLMFARAEGNIESPQSLGTQGGPILSSLCMALLRPEPMARPDARAIREALAQDAPAAHERVAVVSSVTQERFVGRRRECDALLEAFAQAQQGRTVGVLVVGESGVGKTALVSAACERLTMQRGALVLSGRCYETESVPFKAIDSLVDELARHLIALGPEQSEAIIPGSITYLAELFPVLRRVDAIAQAAARDDERVPAHLVRLRAHPALRELLLRLAKVQPVVLVVDDLQWGDLDSEPFLRELLEADETPGVLFIATCRPNSDGGSGASTSGLAAVLQAGSGSLGATRDLRTMRLEPLSGEDAAALIEATTGVRQRPEVVARIVTEAGGNPLFLTELAHAAGQGESPERPAGLDDLIAARVAALPEESRALLEASAVAAWPQPLSLLSEALALKSEAEALATLRARRMARVLTGNEGERITTYHDRIREVAARRLSADARRLLHRKLARAFERAPERDVEALALHWSGAGHARRALRYTLRAAERARLAQANHRAAEYYARALSLITSDPAQSMEVGIAHADALFAAGSVRQAADAYRSLAERAEPQTAVPLRGRALICLLRAGALQEAASLAGVTGRAMGVRIPGSKPAAVASILAGRLALRFVRPRVRHVTPPAAIPEATRRQLDVAKDVSGALGMVDILPGFAVHTRYLRDAIRAGDAVHMTRALGADALFISALNGAPGAAEIERVLSEAMRAAEATQNVAYAALVRGFRGMSCFFRTHRFHDCALEMVQAAPQIEREPTLSWEADLIRHYGLLAHFRAGSFETLATGFAELLKRSRETGNDYLRENLSRQEGVFLHLARHQPKDARELLADLPLADDERISLDSFYHRYSGAELDVYEERWEEAGVQIEQLWAAMQGTSVAKIGSVRCLAATLRGRVSVVRALVEPAQRKQLLHRAAAMEADTRRLRHKIPEYSAGHSGVLAALLGAAQGDLERVVHHLRLAGDAFETCQAFLFSRPVRWQLGRLLKGDEGAALVARAEAEMRAQSMVSPDRFCTWLCPVNRVLSLA